jgi:hypothetical protein
MRMAKLLKDFMKMSALYSEDGGSKVLRDVGTWCHNPEDKNLNLHCCENLKSHIQ